jgi:hypothetical protein
LLIAAGAAGTSMLVHETSDLLSILRDRQKVVVLRATGR